MNQFEIAVAAASGVESVTKAELRQLGVFDAAFTDGRAHFFGDFELLARCNLFLRTAERVYIRLGTFPAPDFDSLYEGIRSLNWRAFVPKNAKLRIDAKSNRSALGALSAIQSVSKKAAAHSLTGSKAAVLPENGASLRAEVAIARDTASVYLDSSGDGLHKRGYRDLSAAAPLKETLAATIIMLSGWQPGRPLCDPFCGSGTFAIEAAMIAANIAPGRSRTFDFVNFNGFPKEKWQQMQAAAHNTPSNPAESAQGLSEQPGGQALPQAQGEPPKIYGFDIDPAMISMSLRHAKRAGVEGIHFQRQDVAQLRSRYSGGMIATNPPYGQRLEDARAAENLYRTLAGAFAELDGWGACVITPHPRFESAFGRTAHKKRKLYNANIECVLYQYFAKGAGR